jgi:tetratricopeptide (TPR) repeat protein
MHSAITMYLAALTTCPTNHLAANELGVLLCRQGRAAQAAILFERTIDLSPSATAYRNLAMAQQKLGMDGQAAANEQESQRLAAIDRAHGVLSRRVGVQWVSPEEMSGVTQVAPLAPAAHNSAASTSNQQSPVVGVPTPERSRWQRTKDFARSLPLIR